MNKMNWKWTLVFAAALVGATVLLDAVAWAGKPAPPTPPPPPIHYQIHYFTAPQAGGSFDAIRAMNNAGVMVGDYTSRRRTAATSRRGFIYDPTIDPDQAIDLNDLVEVPEDRMTDDGISRGNSINDRGAILVTVAKTLHRSSTDPDYEMRGLLIDTRGNPNPDHR